MEYAGQHMEEILKRFEQQDSFIDCFKLLERWKDVPHSRIKEAVDIGILFPFTRSFDYKTCEAINLPVVFSSICDSDGDCSIDVEEATRQGIVFSLANVLLLENKYPKTFTPQTFTKNIDEQNSLAMSLIGQNEKLKTENISLGTKYKIILGELEHTVSKVGCMKREIESLEARLADYRKALAQKAGDILPCIGHGGCRYVCDKLREGTKLKDLCDELYNTHQIRSKQAIGFFLCQDDSKFDKALKFKYDPEDSKENKRKRYEGFYNSIMGYPNKQEKENSGVE